LLAELLRHAADVRLAVIAGRPTSTSRGLTQALIDGAVWEELTPQEALNVLRPGDGALGRLDVSPTLDGIDDGLWALGALAARGVHVLNDPGALLATHDKLLTARILRRHGLPHPAVTHVRDGRTAPPFADVPVVVKPRFGSGGSAVYRCDDPATLAETLVAVSREEWFVRHGALVQALVPPQGYDLRVLVAAGRVAGAVYRIAAPGEWRTNVTLGAVRRPVDDPPREAVALALGAARAVGTSLVGVDLLPTRDGGWVVVELNGAVEFTSDYSTWFDVFAEVALLLQDEVVDRRTRTEWQADAAPGVSSSSRSRG
jgi:tetrahydromethanopterin:alpha-L-glutamate ligase